MSEFLAQDGQDSEARCELLKAGWRINVIGIFAVLIAFIAWSWLEEARASVSFGYWKGSFTPVAFSFTNQTGVSSNSTITSNTVTLTGTGSKFVTATCTNCTLQRNGTGSFLSSIAGFRKGDTVTIRVTSSSSAGAAVTASVKVGATTSSTWSVTTTASVNPSSLSLSQSSNNRNFSVSWTAGSTNGGAGGCKLQYYNGSGWSDISSASSLNCDANSSSASYTLNGDGWKSSWNGTQVRLLRISDSSVMGTFAQTLSCSTIADSSSSTPSVDEDCNGYWDNTVVTETGSWGGWNSGACSPDGSDWLYYGKPWTQSACQAACRALGKYCATFPPDANCACSSSTGNTGQPYLLSVWTTTSSTTIYR